MNIQIHDTKSYFQLSINFWAVILSIIAVSPYNIEVGHIVKTCDSSDFI